MNDFITNVAQMIAESGDEPSYNDILTILRQQQKETNDFTLTPEAYKRLDDGIKEELHRFATATSLADEEKDLAFAATMDIDRILNDFDALKKEIHHIDSDGYIRDDEGVPTILKPLADVMKKRGKLDAFLEKGGKVVKGDGTTLQGGAKKYLLFVLEKVWKYSSEKQTDEWGDTYFPSKTIYSKTGTLEFNTPDEARAQMDKRIDAITRKFGIDKARIAKLEVIPQQITKVDPEAFGFMMNDIDGEGKRIVHARGPLGKNATVKADIVQYDKPTFGYFIEYICYASNMVVKDDPTKILDIAKGKSE